MEYALARAVMSFLTLWSYPRSLAIARGLGRRLFRLFGDRLDIARRNLARAFDDRSADEREALLASHLEHLALSAAEFAWLASPEGARVFDGVRVEGEDHYRLAKAKGRGVVIVSAHAGNWELMPIAWPHLGLERDFTAVAFPQSNRLLDGLVNRVRTGYGCRIARTGWGVREALATLRRGGAILLLADQDAGGGGIFVPWFGTMASTAIGPVQLARRAGAALIVSLMVREGPGRHRVVILPEVTWTRAEREADDLLAGTHAWVAALEAQIRREPSQWFWVHRRWKSAP